jgi:hypothetical protein
MQEQKLYVGKFAVEVKIHGKFAVEVKIHGAISSALSL